MKSLFLNTIILLVSINVFAQATVSITDFEILNNTSWKGTLTYKDYTSGKQTSIDATSQIQVENGKIASSIQYVYEPSKNNKSTVKIKKNGTYYGNEKVIENTLNNNTRTIITTYKGNDNGKRAIMYKTYKFNDSLYSVTKEVQYLNADNRFVRNTYSFNKNQQ